MSDACGGLLSESARVGKQAYDGLKLRFHDTQDQIPKINTEGATQNVGACKDTSSKLSYWHRKWVFLRCSA